MQYTLYCVCLCTQPLSRLDIGKIAKLKLYSSNLLILNYTESEYFWVFYNWSGETSLMIGLQENVSCIFKINQTCLFRLKTNYHVLGFNNKLITQLVEGKIIRDVFEIHGFRFTNVL